MIQELVELGKRLTKGKSRALKEEVFAIDLIINEQGEFQRYVVGEKMTIMAEAITAKKGKARFLLDKCQEVLGVGEKVGNKHDLFMEKLKDYKDVPALHPVFLFYEDNNPRGLSLAREKYSKIDAKFKGENITFIVGTTRLLDVPEVKAAIIEHFDENERKLSNGKICSVCGTANSPVLDEPHGLVKMPKGQTAGSALVSYNEAAFESYGLKGNLNSSICRECARNYIVALDSLLTEGHERTDKKGKTTFQFKHRIRISDTTVVLFWTKQESDVLNPFVFFDIPDISEIRNLFNSVWSGNKIIGQVTDTNMFYCCTLSSAAARIAVRDWTAISLDEYKQNLVDWFKDIEIVNNDNEIIYSSLRLLINATQKDWKPNEKSRSDLNSKARFGTLLWDAAIKGRSYKLPLEILQSVLNRIWKGDVFSPERAAIIKLIINKNTNNNMKSTLDEANRSVAYLCGRMFAVIESMQWKAMGNLNSGVKERFFAAAASQPAYVLGGILLAKYVPIYQHKIGGYLAKELDEIAGLISEHGHIPSRFTTIEQGEYALGYYFQKTHKSSNSNSEESINL